MIPASWGRGFAAAQAASYLSNAPRAGVRVGAALFSKSNLIALGFNTYGQTHPFTQDKGFNRSIHAEIRCLLKRRHFDKNAGLVLYTWRERDDGTPGCSKPCVMCELAIREAGVRRVRFLSGCGQMEELNFS